jgi:hypothetical protein
MDLKMIFAGAYLVGTVLSFTLLLRVLQLSIGLWSKRPSYQYLHTESDIEQPTETHKIFRS